MADDDVPEDDIDAEDLGDEEGADDGELDDAVIDTDATAGDDDEEQEDDDEDADDVEEDLDTILRDRITAGADDDDDDDEEAAAQAGADGASRVPQRAAEEFSCRECFLLVRRSQFAPNRTDCPGGVDGAECPVKNQLGLVPS